MTFTMIINALLELLEYIIDYLLKRAGFIWVWVFQNTKSDPFNLYTFVQLSIKIDIPKCLKVIVVMLVFVTYYVHIVCRSSGFHCS